MVKQNKTLVVNGVTYKAVSLKAKPKKAKSVKNKGSVLDRFNKWASDKGFVVKKLQNMKYERKDGTTHKGLIANMENGSKIFIFSQMFRGESKVKGLKYKVL